MSNPQKLYQSPILDLTGDQVVLDMSNVARKLTFVVPGTPRAKAAAKKGRGGRYYNPSRNHEHDFKYACFEQHSRNERLTGPLKATYVFHFHVDDCIEGSPFCQKPDLDNLIKLVNDALTGHYFGDDRQICRVGESAKVATQGPSRTVLVLEEM